MREYLPNQRSIALLLLFACSLALPAYCIPEVDFRLGLDEQVIRLHYAPLWVEISGLSEPISGRIVAKQTRGLPGATQYPVIHVVADGTIANGIVEVALPMVEPLNPIEVELQDQDGAPLGSRVKSIRLSIRDWTFPVIVGPSTHVDETEAVVAASELPSYWWAYDAADSVWLLDPVTSTTAIETLGDWVVAGGSLVLFTGADFPKIDSPVLRRLLPFASPELEQVQDGSYILSGTMGGRTEIVLSRDGRALLLQMPLGAGFVSLVTLRFTDVTDEELAAIYEHVPPTRRMPVVERMTFETLRSTVVPRPSYLVTPVLALALLVGLWVLARRRLRKEGFAVLVLLAILSVSLSVWSGIYANRHKTYVSLYDIVTSIQVLSSFGIATDWHTLYSTLPIDIEVTHDNACYPLPSALPTTKNVTFASSSELERSAFRLQKSERRDVLVNTTARLDLRAVPMPGGVEVTNRTRNEIQGAYAFVGDHVYELPALRPGTQVYPLLPTTPLLDLMGILRTIEDWLPFRSGGLWLLLLSEDEATTYDDDEGIHRKVRHVTFRFVEGVAE